MLQALASSARSKEGSVSVDKDKITLIDTKAILAGKATSGVTITPSAARFHQQHHQQPSKTLSPIGSLSSALAASGVTISSKSIGMYQ
jgi:hypothetical protein